MATPNFSENIEQNDRVVPSSRRANTWLLPVLLFLVLGGIIGYLWYKLDILEKHTVELSSTVTEMQTELTHTTMLAKNADTYAHSHGFSDAALKTDMQKLEVTPDQLLSIQAVRYFWTPEAQKQFGLGPDAEIGFLAQDVEKVFPELVWTDQQGYKHVDYERFSVLLLEAMRAQQAQIEQLKDR